MDNHWSASIPRSVKVGYRNYTIVVCEPEETDGDFGDHSEHFARLRIRRDQKPFEAANSLLHEMLHACWDVFHLEDGDKEDRTVHSIANALSTVWIDSPEVMEWIGQRLVGTKP